MGTLARWTLKTKWSLNKMSIVHGQDHGSSGHAHLLGKAKSLSLEFS